MSHTTLSSPGTKALEITMRDVLGGLEEAATYLAYQSVPDTLEILSIAPPLDTSRQKAEVITMPAPRCQDVVEYLIQREQRYLAVNC